MILNEKIFCLNVLDREYMQSFLAKERFAYSPLESLSIGKKKRKNISVASSEKSDISFFFFHFFTCTRTDIAFWFFHNLFSSFFFIKDWRGMLTEETDHTSGKARLAKRDRQKRNIWLNRMRILSFETLSKHLKKLSRNQTIRIWTEFEILFINISCYTVCLPLRIIKF